MAGGYKIWLFLLLLVACVSQQKRVRVTERLVSLPENSIIISVKDYEEYAED